MGKWGKGDRVGSLTMNKLLDAHIHIYTYIYICHYMVLFQVAAQTNVSVLKNIPRVVCKYTAKGKYIYICIVQKYLFTCLYIYTLYVYRYTASTLHIHANVYT